jgi:hypothetical protein
MTWKRSGPRGRDDPANQPEATVAEQLSADLACQHTTLAELHIDRAYLSSALVRDRPAGLAIYCKAFAVRNGPGSPRPTWVWLSCRDWVSWDVGGRCGRRGLSP